MVTRAGAYLRISRARDGSTVGIDRQLPPIRALFDRLGWELTEVFSDNDLSAYSGKRRPDYKRMLTWVRDGKLDALGAWHADRFTRRPVENEEIIDLAERYGIQLATVTGEHDLATPAGRLMFRQLGVIARYESEHKSERIRLAMDQLAAAGQRKGGGIRPFGYNRDGLTLHVWPFSLTATREQIDGEATLLAEAAHRYASGESARSIIADWHRRGIRTSAGNPWTATSLRRALTSPRVAGLRQHRGQVVGDAKWPAIVDRPTWERIRALYADPARARGGHPYSYLLTGGALRCGGPGTTSIGSVENICAAQMIARPQRRRAAYECPDPLRGGRRCTGALAAPLESFVSQAVLDALAGPALPRAMRQAAEHDAAAQSLHAQLEADRTSLDQAAMACYLHKTLDEPVYLRIRDELVGRIAHAEKELARRQGADVLVDLPRSRTALHELWDKASIDKRRAIVGAVVQAVIIHPAGPTPPGQFGRTFDPERVTIRWKV